MRITMNQWKHAHEKFVSNWNGTSLFEVASVISVGPSSLLLYRGLLTVAGPLTAIYGWKYLTEFAIIVLPLLSAMTFAADFSVHVIATLVILSAVLVKVSGHHMDSHRSWLEKPFPERYPFISGYRAYINIATAIAILAVDFNVFPRRFAKTETYGVSVMDVGVGAYIVANGIVSPEARHHSLHVRKHVVRTFWGCLVLLVLGFVRLMVLRVTDYHEHVTEYGMHWNFFFTLAAVKFIASILIPLIPTAVPLAVAITGCIIIVMYQYALSVIGLKNYIMYGLRLTLISANREGLLSTAGYLAIYLLAVELGRFLFRNRKSVKQWIYFCLSLIIVDIVCWLALSLVTDHVDQISRRMANLPYVLWQVAYNVFLIILFLCLDLIFLAVKSATKSKVSISLLSCGAVIEAIGQHQLVYFLVANVLTGLVNQILFTPSASSVVALIVLSGYLFLLNTLVLFLNQMGITTKFW